MSFISEDEARARLKSPSNVLNRADRGYDPESLPEVDLDAILLPLDSDPIDPIEEILSQKPPKQKKAKQVDEYFDPFAALKLSKALELGADVGRKPGIRNRTTEENAAVGLSNILLGSSESEQMFGVLPSQQSLIKHGLTSPQDREKGRAPKQELLDSIYSHAQKASDKAFNRLYAALDLLDDSKLKAVTKATDLSRIASDMSRIVNSVTPKDANVPEGGVHFHIYAPEQNEITDYDMVEVRGDGSVVDGSVISESVIESAAREEGSGTDSNAETTR
jgi:hypothetical protein